jgi:hypothetical protein
VQELAKKDVAVIAISLGTVAQGRQWLKKTGFDGELYLDDTTTGHPVNGVEQSMSKGYAAFRLKRGVNVLRLDDSDAKKQSEKVYAEFPDDTALTEKDGDIIIWPGDVFQTGGAFVLGPGNVCDYAYRSDYAGDHVDLNVLLMYASGEDCSGKEITYESTENWFKKLKNTKKLEVSPLGTIREEGSKNDIKEKIAIVRSFVWDYSAYAVSTGVTAGLYGLRNRGNNTTTTTAPTWYTWLGVGVTGFAAYGIGRYVVKRIYDVVMTPRLPYINAKNDVVLLTPVDIDAKVLENGLPECDCGATIKSMPMLGLMEPGAITNHKKPLGRARSETWANEIYDSNEFQTILCYVREFLAKPHPAVGRGGPVCPFVPTSLKKNCIYMSVVRTSALLAGGAGGGDASEREEAVRKILVQLLADFIPIFSGLEPKEGKMRQFKAIILIFPDVKDSEAHSIIDEVQVRVKELFVEKGLMCGEFHATNNASGLRNTNFFPLRTPFPCLAIRHMVPGDIAFMSLDNYPLELRAKFLRGFLDVFGGDAEATDEEKPQVAEAKRKLAECLEELGRKGSQ